MNEQVDNFQGAVIASDRVWATPLTTKLPIKQVSTQKHLIPKLSSTQKITDPKVIY